MNTRLVRAESTLKEVDRRRIGKFRDRMQNEIRDTHEISRAYSKFTQILRDERVEIEGNHSEQLYDFLEFCKKRLRFYGIALKQRIEKAKEQLDIWDSGLNKEMKETYVANEQLKRITQWVTDERSELYRIRREVSDMETEFQRLQPDEEDFKMKVAVPQIGATLTARRFVGYAYFIVFTFISIFISGILTSSAFISADPLGFEVALPIGGTVAVSLLLAYQAFLLGQRHPLFEPIVRHEKSLAARMKIEPLRMFDRVKQINDLVLILVPLVSLAIVDYLVGGRLSGMDGLHPNYNPVFYFGTLIALVFLFAIPALMFYHFPRHHKIPKREGIAPKSS